MKTIGEIIKEARVKKKISLSRLATLTKIKKEFIVSMERENWPSLPDYTVVTGFAKNVAQTLGLDPKAIVALLRRDYPPKELSINPKPDVAREFVWSPKLTFLAGIIVVVVIVFGYLIFQYKVFVSPPVLNVDFPKEAQVVTGRTLLVSGSTDSEATIKINNQPVIVTGEGKFSDEIEVFEGTKEVIIVARSRSGKETVVKRNIDVKLESDL